MKNNNTFTAKSISYKVKKTSIIQDISITIKNNSITGLLGPNGAGKTSLFYILAGLTKANSGDIYLNNKKITNLSTHQLLMHGVAFLPQDSSIIQGLSVSDNILSSLDYTKNNNKKKKLNEILINLQLEHIKDNLGSTLSGGERRRVEIGRCLIMEPKFILLDEPFAGIDPITIKKTKALLKTIAKNGTGILISDHNAPDTLDLCDNIYLVYNGTILTQGTPEEIRENPLVKKHYLGE